LDNMVIGDEIPVVGDKKSGAAALWCRIRPRGVGGQSSEASFWSKGSRPAITLDQLFGFEFRTNRFAGENGLRIALRSRDVEPFISFRLVLRHSAPKLVHHAHVVLRLGDALVRRLEKPGEG